jgi:hypothetical protein
MWLNDERKRIESEINAKITAEQRASNQQWVQSIMKLEQDTYDVSIKDKVGPWRQSNGLDNMKYEQTSNDQMPAYSPSNSYTKWSPI